MKRIGKLMEEIGFRNEASENVKIAFLKNLFRTANPLGAGNSEILELKKITLEKQFEPLISEEKSQTNEIPVQLSFDFDSKTKLG